MTPSEHTVVVHLPLEPNGVQLQELDELGSHVQTMRAALETAHAVTGCRGSAPPLQDVLSTAGAPRQGRLPFLPASRTAQVRQLLQARRGMGWTGRVSSDVIELLVQDVHAAAGGTSARRTSVAPATPGTAPLVVPVRSAAVINLETLEVAGLTDGHVLVHLHLPRPMERAVIVHLNDTRRRWRERAGERDLGAAHGNEKDAQALAHLYARYSHHLDPELPLPPEQPGLQATFLGVTALVRQGALDGERRWFARLSFDVVNVPDIVSDDLIGIDVGIHHPICGSAGDGAVLVENPLPSWAWPEVTSKQGRVTTPFNAARSRVRWYARLHSALQPALTARLLGPTGVLTYRHIALEQLDFRPFQGPAGFGAFMTFSGLAAYLEIVRQLRNVVHVDPRHTSLLDSCTGQPGVRRGLLFHPPGRPARLADLNAAANIRRRGQVLLHREVGT